MGFLLNQTDAYASYVKNHISGVQRAFEEYGKELCELLGANSSFVYSKIANHDESKMSCEEFEAYRMKFYPAAGDSDIQTNKDFDRAWSHHIHNNPHHPEYWIIPKADKNTILDMPVEYIVEMLCDWQSFKYMGKGNGAYDFYYKVDRKEGLLSDRTRKWVEIGLDVFKEDK